MIPPIVLLALAAGGAAYLYEKNGSKAPAQAAAQNQAANTAAAQNALLPPAPNPMAQPVIPPVAVVVPNPAATPGSTTLPTIVIPGNPLDPNDDGQNFNATTTAAASVLQTYLTANGCTTNVDPVVLAFQTAFQADPLGHALANGGADGKYGTSTADALGAVTGDPNTPASCFSN